MVVVPQLPNIDFECWQAPVYANPALLAEVRRDVLNATGCFQPIAKSLLTMRDASCAEVFSSRDASLRARRRARRWW